MGIQWKQSLRAGNDAVTTGSRITLRASIYPVCLVTILFFLWGFSYSLIDTLNVQFQDLLGIDRARSAGIQAAYFGAYPLASLGHANWILRHYSYKACFMWGLFLFGVGSLLTWPALLYQSFEGFCAAMFVIGNGLGSLETAANPYITVCGPPKYSEMRINLSQAFNGIGTVVAPLLGSYVFFANVGEDENSLESVQWVYLAIACFVFLLAGVFYLSNLPEITDADMEGISNMADPSSSDKPLRKQYKLFHAALAQFCYVGSQVAIAGFFINYAIETRPGTDGAEGSQLLAGAQGTFAVGRFVGVFLMKFIRPRKVLLAFFVFVIIFTAAAIPQYQGDAGVAMLYIVLFFESIIFPTIVALGLKGLGRHTKRGSGFIIAGVAGGAVVTPMLGAVADVPGNNTATGMSIPLAFFIMAVTYPICANFVMKYRVPIDASAEERANEMDVSPTDLETNIEKK